MTRKIPKWRVTLYWRDPVVQGERQTLRIAAAWTPARALIGVLMSRPIVEPRAEQEIHEGLYRV
ncbi:hypothetical protein LCGC14_2210190, partial [marine sediment metagenome]